MYSATLDASASGRSAPFEDLDSSSSRPLLYTDGSYTGPLPSALTSSRSAWLGGSHTQQRAKIPNPGRSRSLERPGQRHGSGNHQTARPRQTVAPQMVQAKTGRQVHKSIALPLEGRASEVFDSKTGLDELARPILVLCSAESYDTKKLINLVKDEFPQADVTSKSECLYCQLPPVYSREGLECDLYFFEYGVSIFWGVADEELNSRLEDLAKSCEQSALGENELERDSFSVCYAPVHQSKISNDEITIPSSFREDSGIKLSISHALAQSAKLSSYESRLGDLVNQTKDMPNHLAGTGKVFKTRKEIAQLIGKVFIQKSNVNLLSTVLDTPEYFWSAPDNQQELYKRVSEYLELQERVVVLNNRFEVLTELLNIVREHENNLHIARLEWIVIWLIVVEVVVGSVALLQGIM